MIPVNQPLIAKNALSYVSECIKSGWVSSAGKYIDQFEKNFASYLGTKHAITTTNGTSALHLALVSLGVREGDEVILPAHTMISCAFAIVYAGAIPVLIDVEPDTWNIDTARIEEKITKKTKAIMPVHIYGHPVDMDPILRLAKKYNLKIIEDAAEVHGAEYKGKKAGSLGDLGCFSFYGNKIITTGEGGMLVTNDDSTAEIARRLKDLSHSKNKRFLHDEIGFNYRMTNMQAALGVAQLEEIEKFLTIKQKMAHKYKELLQNIKGLTLPTEKNYAKNVYWMYGVLIEKDFGMTRDKLQTELKKRGIDTRTFFVSIHRQPALRKMGLYLKEDAIYPITDYISEHGLYLPSGLAITEDQIKTVSEAIREIQAS